MGFWLRGKVGCFHEEVGDRNELSNFLSVYLVCPLTWDVSEVLRKKVKPSTAMTLRCFTKQIGYESGSGG